MELAPDWAPAWFALGQARERLGDAARRGGRLRAALRADPERPRKAPGRASPGSKAATSAALPPAYVARLFDDYAPKLRTAFESRRCGYRGHELMAAALDAVAPGRRFRLALDLGCGSGLAGRVLRGRVERLVGVDLSPGMIAQAQATPGSTTRLAVGELVAFLAARPAGAADLAFAADALVYSAI